VVLNAEFVKQQPTGGWQPFQNGSVLRLSGIWLADDTDAQRWTPRADLWNGRTGSSFRLLLRSPEDIAVVTRPTWWTAERLLILVGVLLVLAKSSAIAPFIYTLF
jgi:hypothetical protein